MSRERLDEKAGIITTNRAGLSEKLGASLDYSG